MNSLKRIFTAVILATFTASLVAGPLIDQGNGTRICTKKILIAYFNGINTTPDDSLKSILYLQETFKAILLPVNPSSAPDLERRVAATRFYNPTDSVLRDIAEAYKQSLSKPSQAPATGKWELLTIALRGLNPSGSLLGVKTEELKAVVDFTTKILADKNAKKPIENVKFAQRMNDYMDNKVAIMAVAHSQGNFFADDVYESIRARLVRQSPIQDDRTVTFTHIAPPTPASRIHGSYFTNTEDKVINLVRNLDSTVLRANLTFTAPGPLVSNEYISVDTRSPDFFGHGFLETYNNDVYDAARKIYYAAPGNYIAQYTSNVLAYPADQPQSCSLSYP